MRHAFTLLEVMIAIAVLGISLLALLALHHQNLQGLIRSQRMTRAAMLAQRLMTQAELRRFPPLGTTSGNFQNLFPGRYKNYRWQQEVVPSALFPDVRKVTIRVFYGTNYNRIFDLVEYMHDPLPMTPSASNRSNSNSTPNQNGMQPNGVMPQAMP